ncbi:S8/S53 family peptidase [Bdellovibrio sp. HCB2-146]|uniref:S8/S53 family peptidase n=1 Tax=Bdellovibrio sp. HCB2-146 TaxID=3394362 RepID=UPI0039BCE19A
MLLTLSFLQLIPAQAFVELENRQPVEVEGELLTPFWSQEYIGADLVKKEMQKLTDLKTIPFAVYDIGFEQNFVRHSPQLVVDRAMNGSRFIKAHHGTSVANLINGPGMMSVSEVVDFVQLRRVSPALFYFGAVEDMLKLPVRPMIISNSMGWSSPEVKSLAQKVDQEGIIWVMASGNDHPQAIVEHERTAPVISVGSSSPRGLQTISSQESDQLDVLAPADEYQASIDGNGQVILFGETSGATPLVSGSIANIKALLPSLTRKQVEKLIKRTAYQSLHRFYSKTNKAGLFNAYKMFHVALRLKNICGESNACLEQEIGTKKNYLFSEEVLSAKTSNICETSESLSQQEMETLRKNVLLATNPAPSAKLLSCAYRNEKYLINADYYENLAFIYTNPASLQKKIRQQAIEAVEKGYNESAALRDAELLDESYQDALLKVIANDQGIGAYRAKELLKIYEATPKIEL